MNECLIPLVAFIRRELLRYLRRASLLAVVALLYGMLLYVCWEVWPGKALSATVAQGVVDQLGRSFSFVYVATVLLLTPVYAVGILRAERDNDTIEMLSLTLLTPSTIVLGIFTAMLGVVSVVFLATLPVLLSPDALSALTIWYVVSRVFVVILSACTCIAVGVFSSTLQGRTADSIGLAYALSAAFLFAGVVAATTTAAKFGGGSDLGTCIYLALQCGFTALFLILGVLKLRYFPFERTSEEPKESSLSWRAALTYATARRHRSEYPDGRNPVFVRESGDALHRARINRGSLTATVVLSATLFVGTLLVVQSESDQQSWGANGHAQTLQWYFVTTMLVAAATIPGISTPAWTGDRNTEMEEALDLTMLTRRDRFIGRACAAAALPFIVTACWGAGFSPVLIRVAETEHGPAIAIIGAIGVLAAMFNLLALGRCAARTRLSTPAAVVLVHVIAVAYLALPYFALPLFNEGASVPQQLIAALGPVSAVIASVRSLHYGPVINPYLFAAIFAAIQIVIFALLVWGDLRARGRRQKLIE